MESMYQCPVCHGWIREVTGSSCICTPKKFYEPPMGSNAAKALAGQGAGLGLHNLTLTNAVRAGIIMSAMERKG